MPSEPANTKEEVMGKKISIETRRTNFVGMAECMGKCRHMVNGLVDYKMCAHNYNCLRCSFDQMVADEIVTRFDAQPTLSEVVGF
jgi:hypothetical protein